MVPITPSPIARGIKVLDNGKKTLAGHALISDEATGANANLERIRQFYKELGRNSYDNQGAEIIASVNVQRFPLTDLLHMRQNAAWMDPFKMFIFGAGGDMLAGFAQALDVVGH